MPVSRGLEKQHVEQPVRHWAERNGFVCFKYTPFGKRGIPDHFFFGPFPLLVIIEFKRPGRKVEPGSLQEYTIKILRQLGWPVYVVDNKDDGIRLLKTEKERILGT